MGPPTVCGKEFTGHVELEVFNLRTFYVQLGSGFTDTASMISNQKRKST